MSDYDLVIRGGRVIGADGDLIADVAIRGERIAAIGHELRGRRELDATGRLVLPGAIDSHVHMRSERPLHVYDDTFATGTTAAAFGGVTTIIDQVQVEPGLSLGEGLDRRLEEAAGSSLIDYALHMNPREARDEYLAEMPAIAARGIPSFKFFMVYDGFRVPDRFIFAAMQQVAALDGIALVHAENDEIIEELLRQNTRAGRTARQHNASARPPAMEGEAVYRTLAMAEVAGAKTLIFHLTAAEAVRELRNARARGQVAHGEACLTYLLLGPAALDDPVSGTALDFSPPLRPRLHRDALWAGLADGTIDIVSTDHGPRRRVRGEDGALHTPPGTSGIEVRLALVHTHGVRAGRLSAHQWVDRCCTRPAELFGLERKGRLAPGYDADIVIFDPEREVVLGPETLHSNIDYSTYEGFTAHGFPTTTISRGRLLVHDGELLTAPEAGHGRFVERGPGRAAPLPARPLAAWS
jgi:dihydropyrimidinase